MIVERLAVNYFGYIVFLILYNIQHWEKLFSFDYHDTSALIDITINDNIVILLQL